MEEIKFKGPFHSSQLDLLNSELDKPGLYIWGFMGKKDNEGKIIFNKKENINDINEIEVGNEIFVPYYVGIASGKSGLNIKHRLLSHKKVNQEPGSKYTRVRNGYFESLESNKCLGEMIKTYKKKPSIYPNLINYLSFFNDEVIIKKIYNVKEINGKKTNCPITKENKIILFDELNHLVNVNNNFYFIFCSDIKKNMEFDDEDFKKKLELLESIIFFKLNGFTISKTEFNYNFLKFLNVETKFNISVNNINISIFNKNISTKFEGY
jgi:hypothetical protein